MLPAADRKIIVPRKVAMRGRINDGNYAVNRIILIENEHKVCSIFNFVLISDKICNRVNLKYLWVKLAEWNFEPFLVCVQATKTTTTQHIAKMKLNIILNELPVSCHMREMEISSSTQGLTLKNFSRAMSRKLEKNMLKAHISYF